MATPQWTVKDVVAHMVAWEKRDAEIIPFFWKTKKREPWMSVRVEWDEFNRKEVERYKNYTPKQLLDEWRMWQGKVRDEIAAIGADNIKAHPELFDWMITDAGHYTLNEGGSHYEHHYEQINKALGMKALSVPTDRYLKIVYDFLVQAEPDDLIPQCDAIFIFGTTNGDVARHAAFLYHQKKAPRVVISGKYGITRSEGPSGFETEAEYLAFIAEGEGVPKKDLVLEKKATNTYENVIFGMEICKKMGFTPKTLILVATPYLLRRARACFAKNYPDIKFYGSAMPVTDEFFTPYRIKRIKGELPRLTKYAEEGHLVPTIIPKDVTAAASSL